MDEVGNEARGTKRLWDGLMSSLVMAGVSGLVVLVMEKGYFTQGWEVGLAAVSLTVAVVCAMEAGMGSLRGIYRYFQTNRLNQ